MTILQLLAKLPWALDWQGVMGTRVFLCPTCDITMSQHTDAEDQVRITWRMGGGTGRALVRGCWKGPDVCSDGRCTGCGGYLGEGMGQEYSLIFYATPKN